MDKHPRILIAENERIIAADLNLTLVALGYEVAGLAESGEAVIELARTAKPDVVLMDILLEGSIDGITAAQEIFRLFEIPVVFLTANGSARVQERARAAKPYGYLLKPYRLQELNEAIRVALDRHQITSELFSRFRWLRTMLANLSDGVIAVNSKGTVQFLNSMGEELTGWLLHEAIGKDVSEVFPLQSLSGEPVHSQLQQALTTRKPASRKRFLLCNRKGRKIAIEGSASPILDLDTAPGAVSVFVDVSDRLHREQQVDERRDRLQNQVRSSNAELGETRRELRALSTYLMTGQEEERRWIARELHDDFAQTTASVELKATAALALVPDGEEELKGLLKTICEQVAALSVGLRTVSHRLHPSAIADLGLVSAIRTLVDDYCENGGEATARLPDALPDISLESATALYRITQEALRNVRKHAAEAPVHVSLSATDGMIQLKIEDAGPGFDLALARASGGLGLISMQERARGAGGTLSIATAQGEGTTLTVCIPVVAQD